MLRGYLYRKLIEKNKEVQEEKKEAIQEKDNKEKPAEQKDNDVRKDKKPANVRDKSRQKQPDKEPRREEPEKKTKKELHNVHENPSLFAGMVIGLLGGVLGNLIVFSAKDTIDSISAGNSWIIFLASLGGFIVVIWFLLSRFRQIMYR